jgi:DNA-binding LacI/PurR family transcriptional regulator
MLSFGEILNANLMFVKPTYMTQQPIKVGSIAATLMLSRLDAHDLPNREQTVEAQLESGDSLKYLPVK